MHHEIPQRIGGKLRGRDSTESTSGCDFGGDLWVRLVGLSKRWCLFSDGRWFDQWPSYVVDPDLSFQHSTTQRINTFLFKSSGMTSISISNSLLTVGKHQQIFWWSCCPGRYPTMYEESMNTVLVQAWLWVKHRDGTRSTRTNMAMVNEREMFLVVNHWLSLLRQKLQTIMIYNGWERQR